MEEVEEKERKKMNGSRRRRRNGEVRRRGSYGGAVFCSVCLCRATGDLETAGRRTGTGLANHHSAAANAKSTPAPNPANLGN